MNIFNFNVTEWFSAQLIRDKFYTEVKYNLLPKGIGIHFEANSYYIDEYECKFLVRNNGDVLVDKNNSFIKKFLRTKKLERICNETLL